MGRVRVGREGEARPGSLRRQQPSTIPCSMIQQHKWRSSSEKRTVLRTAPAPPGYTTASLRTRTRTLSAPQRAFSMSAMIHGPLPAPP